MHKPFRVRTAFVPAVSLALAAVLAPTSAALADPREDSMPTRPHTGADPYADTISDRTRHAAGLYFSGPFARRFGAARIINVVRSTGLTAAVIDLKDSAGIVYYDSDIPELEGAERPYAHGTAAFVRTLKDAGIYTIARITCFSDNRLPRLARDRAILHTIRNDAWVSWGTGGTWLDPYNEQNHELVRRLAVDAERLGFDEVQLDYVRFPVDDGVRYARYPAERTDILRRFVLKEMLRRIDASIHIPLGVDVFGIAALHAGDPSGLGQSLVDWVDYVDIFSPMLYINAHSRWRRSLERGRAETLVRAGTANLRARIGPEPIIRPFLQAFQQGSDYYNEGFIHEQIQAARFGHSDGYLFWHPGVSYSLVGRAVRQAGTGLGQFTTASRERRAERRAER